MAKKDDKKNRAQYRKKRQRAKPAPTLPQFGLGDEVRVKHGTTDPDFPDIPLGGWAGTIEEVDDEARPPSYLVAWNQYTLDHLPPIFRKRCERDDLEMESTWLGEADLEPDHGEPPNMEQPTDIRSEQLNLQDEDDRVRVALGLTGDDPLPDVDADTLSQYHDYLASQLKFPFPGAFSEETGPLEETTYEVKVKKLVDLDDCDESLGLLCEADIEGELEDVPLGEIEVKKGNANRQLVEDYSYWFWNHR